MLTDIIYNTVLKDNFSLKVIGANYSLHLALQSIDEIVNNNIQASSDKIEESQELQDLKKMLKADVSEKELSALPCDNLCVTVKENNSTSVFQIIKTHVYDAEDQSNNWAFDYEQEFPESQWGNLMGTLRNNKRQCLFYAVGANDKGEWTTMKLFHSIDYNEDSFIVSYPWNDQNDQLVIDKLNEYRKLDKVIEDKVLQQLPFTENS